MEENNSYLTWYILKEDSETSEHITKKMEKCFYKIKEEKSTNKITLYFWDKQPFEIATSKTITEAKAKAEQHYAQIAKQYIDSLHVNSNIKMQHAK